MLQAKAGHLTPVSLVSVFRGLHVCVPVFLMLLSVKHVPILLNGTADVTDQKMQEIIFPPKESYLGT